MESEQISSTATSLSHLQSRRGDFRNVGADLNLLLSKLPNSAVAARSGPMQQIKL